LAEGEVPAKGLSWAALRGLPAVGGLDLDARPLDIEGLVDATELNEQPEKKVRLPTLQRQDARVQKEAVSLSERGCLAF
jgi:hypothetical protein